MLKLLFSAAVIDATEPVLDGQTSKLFGYNMRDVLLLASVAFLLGIALFLFAYVTRKKRQSTIGPAHSRAIYRGEPEEEEDSEGRRYRKKRRRRNHPDQLPRNPTLQETGGLPPLRPEQEPAEPTQ